MKKDERREMLTPEQKTRETVGRLLILTLRCRSIVVESWCKRSGQEELTSIDEIALEQLDNVLFGRTWNLLGDLLRVLAKPVIAPIDYYNLLVRAHQSDMLLFYGSIVGVSIQSPEASIVADGFCQVR